MNEKSKAIILSDSDILDLFLYSIDTTFNFEVSIAGNWEQFNKCFSENTYSLIFVNITEDKEILSKINKFLIEQQGEGKTIDFALIVIGEYDQNDENVKNIMSLNLALLFENKFSVMKVNKFIIENFKIDETYELNEYSQITLKTLMRFKLLSFPCFIKLKTRYLKVLSVGDVFCSDDLEKYYNKGINYLFIRKKTSKWILDNLDNVMDDIISSDDGKIELIVPVNEVENEAAEETIKEVEEVIEGKEKEVVTIATSADSKEDSKKEESKEEQEKLTEVDESKIKNAGDLISNSMGKPFQLHSSQVEEIKLNLAKVVKTVIKNPDIYKILKMLKINRNKDEYYTSHVGSLINVCTAIAVNVEWKTERTIEKLVYASYFHDAGLSEKPELSKIKTETDAIEKGLSADDLKLVLTHPIKMANILRGIDGFPDDVHLIIEQHHESPTGNGFPKKITSTRIIPLSALFILSHGFIDYMIDNENWTIADFISKAKKDYPGNAFRKIIQSLELVNI
ncbi:MAG: hypothetical protein HQK51_01970 [Oligoflexia bacterium]|nr:hypothetical protein [Oligoflexia bacterium]